MISMPGFWQMKARNCRLLHPGKTFKTHQDIDMNIRTLIRSGLKIMSGLILTTGLMLTTGCTREPSAEKFTITDETIETAITNVTVIDAINGIRQNQTVIFAGDSITAIQAESIEVSVDEIIDGRGKFLIPGLWDFHVHLTYEAELKAQMPALFLSYGITSVRDTGGLLEKVLPVVETMRADGAIAPRVFYAGPLLDGTTVVYDGESRPEIGVQNATPAEAQQMVAKLKSLGVDFIKIYELVEPEVFTAMVAAARQLDLPIDSHVPLSMRASIAGPQVDSIEHMRNIELDCASNARLLHESRLTVLQNPKQVSGYQLRSSIHKLQRLDAIAHYDEAQCDKTLKTLSKTIQVPTLRLNALRAFPPYQRADWAEALEQLPAGLREKWQQSIEMSQKNSTAPDLTFANWSLFLIGRMHEHNIPIAAGTDTPIGLSVPGYSLHSELELLVQSGLKPLEAIEAATVRPAEYFSLLETSGSIDIGKQADMVLLEANPLLDIRNTRKIFRVVSKGHVYSPQQILDTL